LRDLERVIAVKALFKPTVEVGGASTTSSAEAVDALDSDASRRG
jgi:hypothetical protein